MNNIDETTKGLATKISIGPLLHIDEAGAFTRALSSFANAGLAKLGSGTARGKLKQAKAAKYLMNKWQEFTAIGNKPWTADTLHLFLARTFNQQLADALIKQAEPTDDKTNTNTTNTNDANNSTVNSANTSAAASQKVQQPTSAEQNNVKDPDAAQVFNALQSQKNLSQPKQQDVMNLVYKLLKITKGKPAEYKTAIAALKKFQSDPEFIQKVPALGQIDLSKFTESHIRQTCKFATYLVENRILSKSALNRAYLKFFITEETKPRIISKQEMYRYFEMIAAKLLDSKAMSVGDDDDDNNDNNDVSLQKGNTPSRRLNQRIDPSKTIVNLDALETGLKDIGIDNNLINSIKSLVFNNTTVTTLIAKMMSKKINIPQQKANQIIKAIMDAHI